MAWYGLAWYDPHSFARSESLSDSQRSLNCTDAKLAAAVAWNDQERKERDGGTRTDWQWQ